MSQTKVHTIASRRLLRWSVATSKYLLETSVFVCVCVCVCVSVCSRIHKILHRNDDEMLEKGAHVPMVTAKQGSRTS